MWYFCRSMMGSIFKNRTSADVGSAPFDESIFGVRDLAGSNAEHTSGKTMRDRNYRVYRGGSWNHDDEFYFHLASRNGIVPWRS